MSVPINQSLVKRTMVDTKSHVDLITLITLQKIAIDSSLIRLVKSSLTSFSQIEKITLEGTVVITVGLRIKPYIE